MARRKTVQRTRARTAKPAGDARLRTLRSRLAKALPEPRCELEAGSPWQLLVATILSAQSTDKQVNLVTPELFKSYPTPAALAGASSADVERLVKSTGFFRNKAKAIQGASRILVEQHGGELPRTLEELVELPGVARKTANVVLGTCFRIASGIAVDTHAARVSQRLGLTSQTDPLKIEGDLCALFPRATWPDTSHRLVLHGRYVCTARKPRCAQCPLAELCPSREHEPEGSWSSRAAAERRRVESRGAEAE
jgi:endonuclease III